MARAIGRLYTAGGDGLSTKTGLIGSKAQLELQEVE